MFQLLICKQGFTVLKRLWHLLPRLHGSAHKVHKRNVRKRMKAKRNQGILSGFPGLLELQSFSFHVACFRPNLASFLLADKQHSELLALKAQETWQDMENFVQEICINRFTQRSLTLYSWTYVHITFVSYCVCCTLLPPYLRSPYIVLFSFMTWARSWRAEKHSVSRSGFAKFGWIAKNTMAQMSSRG